MFAILKSDAAVAFRYVDFSSFMCAIVATTIFMGLRVVYVDLVQSPGLAAAVLTVMVVMSFLWFVFGCISLFVWVKKKPSLMFEALGGRLFYGLVCVVGFVAAGLYSMWTVKTIMALL